jgi:phytoene desaturase
MTAMFIPAEQRPPATHRADSRPHAIVIGSGFGGLAAAVRLGVRGFRVTVLERLDAPGGRAYVFSQDGFTFDAGPTIITAPFLLEELWRLCGRRLADDVELRALDPFYAIRFHDGAIWECCGDDERMRAEVRKLAPGDLAGYERFMRESEAIYRVGFEKLGHVPFGSPLDMVRILPDLMRLGAWRSVYGHVAARVKDERLRMALSFHPLFIGGNPFNVTAIYSLIAFLERRFGVHAAIGGTGSIVQGLVKLIESQRGQVRHNAEVSEIVVENGAATGVRLADGETIASNIVVSNADMAHTYLNLLAKVPRRRWNDERLAKARYSMSLFVWYFGTRRQFPKVRHHTIIMGPRYQGLLNDIFERKILTEDFSLYLHRPTATDPSLAPEGRDSFYVLSPVPHQDSGIDWTKQAEPYRRAIAKRLDETELPGFESEIVSSRIMTPVDFAERLLSHKGAAFGLEPVLLQSAWFRPNNRSEDVKNLYLVGAGTHPGAGVPGVISSARVLDTVVPDATTFA